MRLFVGIPLADAVVRELTIIVARLRAQVSPGDGRARWIGPDSWHITLQFLGGATQEQYECVSARLGEVRAAPVPVRLGELGCFDRAGVLFADVVVTPELAELRQQVVAATRQCGFVAETRPFHPHITLARETGSKGHGDRGSNKAVTLRELAARAASAPALSGFTVREFLLYESYTGREGARYEVRERFALGGRG
jgi:RNA 2',3'-cyclic 3'-phosphodiesterase